MNEPQPADDRTERIAKIRAHWGNRNGATQYDAKWLLDEVERLEEELDRVCDMMTAYEKDASQAEVKLAQILERLKDEAPYTPARDLIDEVQALIDTPASEGKKNMTTPSQPEQMLPRCVYCGELHALVFAEHDCPNSMGFDAASMAMTNARRRLIKPRGEESK